MNVRVLTNLWLERRAPFCEAALGPFLDKEGRGILRAIIADAFVRALVLGHEAETLEIEDGG